MNDRGFEITDSWIVALRGKKNVVDPYKPYAYLVEKELTRSGSVEETATIFLTNSECPFHCLMCDLWKNTIELKTPVGAIPAQIRWALDHLPPAENIKLYNSGSFFDAGAIPPEDYKSISDLVSGFKTVIVENHPRLINDACLHFRDMLKPELQIAMGLETVHPGVLSKLNKRMTLKEFSNATDFLRKRGISTRTFILLKPPFLSESDGIFWAKKSIDFAFNAGTECCIVIPVRDGNGAMEFLSVREYFSRPEIKSLEEVVEYGISLKAGRVFADLWDIEKFSTCNLCMHKRINRLESMNYTGEIPSSVVCTC